MPHLLWRISLWVDCGRCAFQSVERPARSFGPKRRIGRQFHVGKSPEASIRSAIAAASTKPSNQSTAPLNWGLSPVVNSCLTPLVLHRSPRFLPQNSPLPSDRTINTLEGTPSALLIVFARDCSKCSKASDLWRRKYNHLLYLENSSRFNL